MSIQKIPLGQGSQTLQITLGQIGYVLTLTWRTLAHAYTIDLSRMDGTSVLAGVPLLAGVDLLAQYQHRLVGRLFVRTIDGNDPSYDSLGRGTQLYWSDT